MGSSRKGVWSKDEHDRFLDAISHFPHGPWSAISKFVCTRSARQVQTHAQKYYEKVARHLRGLQRDRKPVGGNEHRIEERILSLVLSADKMPIVERQLKASPISQESKRDGQHETTPPCLLRLRELPPSPVSVEHVTSASNLSKDATVTCDGHDRQVKGEAPLPSLEQSLDFLIDLFSNPEDRSSSSEPLAAEVA